nr:replication initiation protein [uncultured phage]
MFNPANEFGYDFYAPCNHCVGCQQRKRAVLATKFSNALKEYPNAYFLTITFSNQNVTRLPHYKNKGNSSFNTMLSKYDVKRILANIRNKLRRAYKLDKNPKIHYLLCGEYGPKTLRAHYHIALFLPMPLPNLQDKGNDKLTCKLFNSKQYGFYDLERIKPGSSVSNYITKYMTKSFESHSVELSKQGKPISRLSLEAERLTIKLSKENNILSEDLKFQAPFILKSRRFGLNDDLKKDIDQGILSYHYKRKYITEAGKIHNQELYQYYYKHLIENWNKALLNNQDGCPSRLVVKPSLHSDPF